MRRYEELERAEAIKIGQKIKVKIKWWADSLIPETESVYQDQHVNGEGSIRIYKIPENHSFIVGDETEGTVTRVHVASRLTHDSRKKIYINLENLKRVYSLRTSHYNSTLTVMVKCGYHVVSQNEFPDIKVQYAGDVSELKVDSEVRMTISDQGVPQSELIRGADYFDGDEMGQHTIRTYRFNGEYKFEKGHLIKAWIDSITTGDVLAPFKWKRIVVTMRDPKRVYFYRINTAEENFTIERWCGERRIRTRQFPIIKEEFEALHNGTIYRVIKKTFKNGRALRTTYTYAGSVEGRVKESFANLRSLLGNKIGPERMKKIRKTIRDLPQLESEPLIPGPQYDYFTERDAKRQHTRNTVRFSGENKSTQLKPWRYTLSP